MVAEAEDEAEDETVGRRWAGSARDRAAVQGLGRAVGDELVAELFVFAPRRGDECRAVGGVSERGARAYVEEDERRAAFD